MRSFKSRSWIVSLCMALTASLPGIAAEQKIKSAGSEYNATSPIGINLTGVVDWSSEWAFSEPYKQAREWRSSSGNQWDDGRELDLDEHGWVKSLQPGQLARTVMFWSDGQKHYPAGKYEILYEGEGKLVVFPQRVIAAEPGKITLAVDPKRGGISLALEATNPDNYIRNIRVVMPKNGCGPKFDAPCELSGLKPGKGMEPFFPAFLESIKPYRVIRFMDWMNTNNSKIKTFDDRPKLTDATYTVKGVPLEIMVDLANTMKADPWFSIPHLADDDYVEKFATYVRDNLDPDRKVYIEYSNEVWNSLFSQSRYATKKGQELKLSDNDYQGLLRFYALRSVQIFKIWERVFSGTSRLVRVLSAQAANPWTSETVLSFEDSAKHADVLAIAPYFGGYAGYDDVEARIAKMTPAELIEELHGKGLDIVKDWLTQQKELANRFGVDLVAYEGGQHLVGVGNVVNNETINALFAATNRDPAMKPLYLEYLDLWREMGGALFMQFVNTSTYSKWGNWGAYEYLAQPLSEAPKADALQTYIKAHPTERLTE